MIAAILIPALFLLSFGVSVLVLVDMFLRARTGLARLRPNRQENQAALRTASRNTSRNTSKVKPVISAHIGRQDASNQDVSDQVSRIIITPDHHIAMPRSPVVSWPYAAA